MNRIVRAAPPPVDGKPIVERVPPADVLKDLDRRVEKSLPAWLDFYKSCHAHPELSLQEKESADHVAKLLAATGARVTTEFGGYGVVGVMENGSGRTILIRTDLDALPITEETGLPYASKVKVTQPDGTSVGVMHACGHDVHQTVFIGTAQMLAAMKDHWHGKVVLIAQPAEEIGRGALMMIQAGLFEKFGKPDACIALHVMPDLEAGTVGVNSGWVYANVDSVDITVYGRGGHGARPHEAVDPIVAASQIVNALQTIVSRRMNPQEPAVVTVGSFHAGTKHNIIPGEAKLQLTVRSFTDEARNKLLDSIRQIVTDTAKAAGCIKPPDVVVREDEFTPACYNDASLAAASKEVFTRILGAERVFDRPPSMGAEDFGQFSRASGAPGYMFQLGIVESSRFAASKRPGAAPLPSIHSATFQPDPAPTVSTGVRCMTSLALSLLAGQ
jgi:hippurate hydrolase